MNDPTDETDAERLPQLWRRREVIGAVLVAILAIVGVQAYKWYTYVPPAPMAVLIDVTGTLTHATTGIVVAGDAFITGTISLDSGTAEVLVHSGATVRLIGTTTLNLTTPMKLDLATGGILIDCPPSAAGFTVTTGGLTITDLGTRFGVSAAGGVVEVHMFEGSVLVQGAGPAGKLKAGDAIRWSGGQLTPLKADPDAFHEQ